MGIYWLSLLGLSPKRGFSSLMLGLCHGKRLVWLLTKREKFPKKMSGKQKKNPMNLKEDSDEKRTLKIIIVMSFFPFWFLFLFFSSLYLLFLPSLLPLAMTQLVEVYSILVLTSYVENTRLRAVSSGRKPSRCYIQIYGPDIQLFIFSNRLG